MIHLALFLSSTGTVRAQPSLELVEDRGAYLLMNDADRLFETTDPRNWQDYRPLLQAIERGYRAVHRDNSRILLVFFAPPFDMGGGYHRPLANTVHGIGHAHGGQALFAQGPDGPVNGPDYYDNEGIWDGTPGSSLQGIAYLGSWSEYILTDSGVDQFSILEMKSFLSHEVGHSWLAFPWYLRDGDAGRNLLDLEEAHWSVFVDSGFLASTGDGPRSLLGGQDWYEVEEGVFSTEFRIHELDGFSDLDLYLLGVLPPEQVDPFLVIERADRCTWAGQTVPCPDPTDGNLFPPFITDDPVFTIEGEARRVSVDDLIAFEGPRRPGFPDAPTDLPVTFLVVKRPETTLSGDDKLAIERLVVRSVDLWDEMTRGLLPMVNRSSLEDETPGLGESTCIEDQNTRCLVAGRFEVRVQWRTADGDEGLGRVVDFGTDNSGIFWFFGVDNWELMLKVLDACSFNERYWVFSAATTDVEYTLTVTDTTTGESRRYQNPLGRRAETVTDTDAFVCP